MSASPPDGPDPVSLALARRASVPLLVLLLGGGFLHAVYVTVR